MYFGFDVGSSSAKAVLVDEAGRIVSSASRIHEVDRGPGGWVGMDMRIWWREFVELYTALVVEPGLRISGIGVSGMGPCIAATDEQDRPLADAALYGIDQRARSQAQRLTRRFSEEHLLEKYGSVLTTQAGGPKLAWFAEHHGQPARFYMPASWIVRRLTGEYVLDHHSASQCTPLYLPATGTWDPEMVEAISPGTEMPRLGWSSEIAGVTRATGELSGLEEGIPVIFGTIDAWAEQESVGGTTVDELFLMYGSTMFLVANTAEPLRHPSMWGTTGTRPGTFNLAGGLATSGTLTHWLKTLTNQEDFGDLTEHAQRIPPGAEGLLALPYFSGERSPIQDPDARGALIGLTLDHTGGHVYRALLESTALAVRHNIDVMREAGADIHAITCAGGGSSSQLWTGIVSDVTGLPQTRRRYSVGASYGAAFMVAQRLGAAPDLDEWNPVQEVVQPRSGNRGVYDEFYLRYRQLHTATAEIQHFLAGHSPNS